MTNGVMCVKAKLVLMSGVLSTAALALPAEVAAQTADSWSFQATIYGYFPTISGKTTFPQSTAVSDISVDADTILKNLQSVFMGAFEAKKGRWGAFTDVLYMDVGNSRSGTREFSVGGSQIPAGSAANLDFNLKGWIWTLTSTYRALQEPAATLDVLAGARLLNVEQNLGWQLSGNVGAIPLQGRAGVVDASITNWDAIIGVKGRMAVGESRKWFVPYYLDVGTGESNLTWQAMGGIGYSFKWGDVAAVWRHIDYDMKSGKKLESMAFDGPAIGAVFRW